MPRFLCRLACCTTAALFLLLSKADAQVSVEVVRLGGDKVSGRFMAMTTDTIRLSIDDAPATVDVEETLSLSVSDVPTHRTPPIDASGWALLTTGDWLRLQPLSIDDESILTRWANFPAMPPLSLPLEVCRGIAINAGSDRMRQGQVFSRLIDRTEESDEIVLRNGDRISGTFVQLADSRVLIETSAGEVPIDVSGSESLAFNPDLISTPDMPDSYATLVLSDGSSLWAETVESDGNELLVETVTGFEVAIPVSVLREIQFYSPRCVSLTTVNSVRRETTPFLSTRRNSRTGTNVIGGPLCVAGHRMATGLGVSSGTSVTWPLVDSTDRFVASVGVDDAAGGQGSVVFEVLLDGVSAWKSERLTGRDPAVVIPAIELANAAELTLRVGFADRGHVFDFANWCNPVLIYGE